VVLINAGKLLTKWYLTGDTGKNRPVSFVQKRKLPLPWEGQFKSGLLPEKPVNLLYYFLCIALPITRALPFTVSL
jgi:hypothetical protein